MQQPTSTSAAAMNVNTLQVQLLGGGLEQILDGTRISPPQIMPSCDDLLEQILAGFPNSCSASSWPNLSSDPRDRLNIPADSFPLQQQMFLAGEDDSGGLISIPVNTANINVGDSVDPGVFVGRSHHDVLPPVQEAGGDQGSSLLAMYNGGFGFPVAGNCQIGSQSNFPQGGAMGVENYGAAAAAVGAGISQLAQVSALAGGSVTAPPQRQRVRARRGQATDPHSIAERLRRERIAERMKSLQELVPNANKTDKASMLDEIIEYVKFLQLQVKVLSMSRVAGAGTVAPQLDVADHISSDQATGIAGRNTIGGATEAAAGNMTAAENQVARLMEEDMGSAMQYLQGKGLCLMPISLATAISTAGNLAAARKGSNSDGGTGDLIIRRPSSFTSLSSATSAVQSNNLDGAAGEGSTDDWIAAADRHANANPTE